MLVCSRTCRSHCGRCASRDRSSIRSGDLCPWHSRVSLFPCPGEPVPPTAAPHRLWEAVTVSLPFPFFSCSSCLQARPADSCFCQCSGSLEPGPHQRGLVLRTWRRLGWWPAAHSVDPLGDWYLGSVLQRRGVYPLPQKVFVLIAFPPVCNYHQFCCLRLHWTRNLQGEACILLSGTCRLLGGEGMNSSFGTRG